MTYSAIDPIERHHLRRTWLLLDKIKVESFGEVGLAFHAKRSLQYVRNVLEPIRKLRSRPESAVSIALHSLYQIESRRVISADVWRGMDTDALAKCRAVIAELVVNDRRLLTPAAISPEAVAAWEAVQ